tara:strand:+ start:1163 stop:1459 length:297 start_codon:yes stop_codon:yes gene_type:complete
MRAFNKTKEKNIMNIQKRHTIKTKQERFEIVGIRRLNLLLDAFDNFNKISNKKNYEYTQKQQDAMFKIIKEKVKESEKLFKPKIINDYQNLKELISLS